LRELATGTSPPRPELLELLREQLTSLLPGAPIDFVAVEPDGRVVLVLVGEAGRDLELVGIALAQRAWVEPRVRDWLQLAPDVGARSGAGVRVLLLCPDFRPQTRAAAGWLGGDVLELAAYHCLRTGDATCVVIEGARTPQLAAPPGPAPSGPGSATPTWVSAPTRSSSSKTDGPAAFPRGSGAPRRAGSRLSR
jgi:hypothetical protein